MALVIGWGERDADADCAFIATADPAAILDIAAALGMDAGEGS